MTSMAERKRRKKTITVAKGAPRRAGVDRHPCGKIIAAHRKPVETQEEAMATVRAQPHRKPLAAVENASKGQSNRGVLDEVLMGSSIGRLYFDGRIQRHQYEAAIRYGENMARDRAIMGLPPATVQAMGYGEGGRTSRADVSSQAASEASKRINEAKVALLAAGDENRGDPIRPYFVVRKIALEDCSETELREHEVGALRLGLNALARLYGVEIGGDRRAVA